MLTLVYYFFFFFMMPLEPASATLMSALLMITLTLRHFIFFYAIICFAFERIRVRER